MSAGQVYKVGAIYISESVLVQGTFQEDAAEFSREVAPMAPNPGGLGYGPHSCPPVYKLVKAPHYSRLLISTAANTTFTIHYTTFAVKADLSSPDLTSFCNKIWTN